MAEAPTPVLNGLLSRELKVEATFKFTSDDFPAKDIKVISKRAIKDVTTKRILLPKQTERYKTQSTQFPAAQLGALDPKTVALLVFKLPAVPDNKGISPVLINSIAFNSNDPNNGWQKLEADGTAVLWDAFFGDPNTSTTPAIGIKPDSSGSFYYFHQNSVDVIVDVTIGLIDGPPPSTSKEKGEDEPSKKPEAVTTRY